VTLDHQSLEDGTVTLRDRDTLEQERVAIDGLADELSDRLAREWRSPKIATAET
jgi:glycyl-tRNA synthetase